MKKQFIFFLMLSLATIIVSQNACIKEESPPILYTNGEGDIGPDGGIISVSDSSSAIYSASINIPAGALANTITIKIVPVQSGISFPLDSTIQLVSFEPAGLTFSKPVVISLPFKDGDIENAVIYYYDITNQLISEMPLVSIDEANKTVSGSTDHFSCYLACEKYLVADITMVYCSEENRIGAKFEILGWNENVERVNGFIPGLNRIPVRKEHSSFYGLTAEELCINTVQPIYSILDLGLCKGPGYSTTEEQNRGIRLRREKQDDSFTVMVYNENGSNLVYESGELVYEGDNGLEIWLVGKPLVFYFDNYNIDKSQEYWIRARWKLSTDPDEEPVLSLTMQYEINNNNDCEKPEEMEAIHLDGMYEFAIQSHYVNTDIVQPCPGIPTVVYEGKTYNTVQIGEQCWLNRNLNIGLMIHPVNGGENYDGSQTNNGFIEKYCYDNINPNCQTGGGLYQWGEAMQYSTTEGAQGICPPGWHIPTDDEWKVLEGTVDSIYGVGNLEWNKEDYRGSNVGYHLKGKFAWMGNSAIGDDKYGFGAAPYGKWNIMFSLFVEMGNGAHFWSSTMKNTDKAWDRSLISGDSYNNGNQMIRRGGNTNDGLSVRCIKNN